MSTNDGTGQEYGTALRSVFKTAAMLLCLGTLVLPAYAGGCPASLVDGQACGQPSAGNHRSPVGDARFVANPVDVITGSKVERRIDWKAFGSRLAFERHYHSGQGEINRGLGGGWRHGMDLSLMRLPDSGGLRLVQADGRSIDFALTPGPGRAWSSERDGDLELSGGAYVWQVPDGRRITFPGPRPVRIDWPDGDRLDLQWTADRLVGITDAHGRRITLHWTSGPRPSLFDYDPVEETVLPGHLDSVSLPDGTSLLYRYDNRHRLRATYRNDAQGSRRIERAEYDDAHDAALRALHDRDGTRGWDYAADGRVKRFLSFDGRTLEFGYRDLPADPGEQRGETIVRRKDGLRVDYRWRIDARETVTLTRIVEHPCPACAGEPREITPPPPPDAPEPARSNSVPLEGVRVERFDTASADIRIDALEARFTVRFDRRSRVRTIDPLDESLVDRIDGDRRRELERVSRGLDAAVFVDADGLVRQRKSDTSDVCPLAIVRSCDELNHDIEMARLSICAYAEGPCANAGPWEEMDPGYFGLRTADFENRHFRSVPYRHTTTGELVVAFRGTVNATDVMTDVNQHEGRWTQAYEDAASLALALQTSQHDVTYTGHSLGGGLATIAALTHERPAIGFNSAAMTEATADRHGLDLKAANQHVTHLLVPGEAVTFLQETPMRDPSGFGLDDDYDRIRPDWITHPAPGRRDVLSDPRQVDIDRVRRELPWLARAALPRSTEEAIARHMMELAVSSLYTTMAARCGHLPPTP